MKSAALAVLVLSALGAIQVGDAVDYCLSRYSCNGVANIACNNNGAFAEACPPDVQMVNMTSVLRTAILSSHNAKRNALVNETLSGTTLMRILTWNAELARLASLNLKRCVFGYDSCHKTAKYQHTAQNIAKTWWTGPNPPPDTKSIILMEIDYWWSGRNSSRPRNFNVMASEHNVELGCAAITYTDSQFNNDYSLNLVCNYGRKNNPVVPLLPVV